MHEHEQLQRLMDAYAASGISRREVMKRAAALGISLNTVRTQMTAALRHLRERLLR